MAIPAAELEIQQKHTDGRIVRRYLGDPYPPTRAELYAKIESGKSASSEASLNKFGFRQFTQADKYRSELIFNLPQGKVASFPWTIEVVEPAASDILASYSVSLEGPKAALPKEKQERAVVQQIKIGNRIWLVYRRLLSAELGNNVSRDFRICELPGKVEDLKVEGAYGSGNPLTITYRESTYTKFTTTHVIHSNGYPWTAEDEKRHREKLNREENGNHTPER